MTMTRKQFLRSVVGVGVGVVGVAALSGCGGDDGGGSADAPVVEWTTARAVIVGNHGHVIVVAIADVNAGVDKTYDITGTGGHLNSVTITGAQFAQIKGDQTLMVMSTSGAAHTHAVTFMCV